MTTTAIALPSSANEWYLDHPDEWEPGIPIYNSRYFPSYSRAPMFTIKNERNDPGEEFTWNANISPSDGEYFFDNFGGATMAGPGTEFYGAIIGPLDPK